MRSLAPLLLALAAGACAQNEPRPPAMDDARSLAAAETAFAAHSMREDMRAAFIAHFAADGVFVRGGWVNAREFLAPRPAPPITLDWRPAYTEVAASGELGLSTGPWKLASRNDPHAPPAYGQFVSVWKREAGGPWRVVVDLGISHPQPVFWDRPLESIAVASEAPAPSDTIEEAERRFGHEVRASGARAAYAKHGSSSLRLYREQTSPMAGKTVAIAWPGLTGERRTWTVEKSETARSGDFGYARGAYSAAAGGKPEGWYLRVWHREAGAWRIALDVTNPAPRE
ncbi:MAG: nuclear transport factor 2 family protein [Burkholderiales bacterium]|nr:nuclear transport factor 2 family protein [Burkholderiales bacterium]